MPALAKQATKTERGMAFPAGAFAFVPDREKPSTWKLRLFDRPADVPATPSVRLTAAATQALSPSGFRGQRVQIPAADLSAVKRRVAAAWLKARSGRGVGQADLPSALKSGSKPKTVKAVSLDLNEDAQSAFLRLSKSLVPMGETFQDVAKSLTGLGLDLVANPVFEEEVEAAPESVLKDLLALVVQIKNPGIKERVEDAVAKIQALGFQVPQNLEPEPEEQAKSLSIRLLKQTATPSEERTVFGVVLEPEVVDSQNDIYDADEIRKTAFKFMEQFQQFGLMHKKIVPSVLPLESFLAPVDMEIGGTKIKKGTWLLRVRVLDDKIWKDVKSGRLTGFSIGGSAIRTPDTVKVKG